MAQANGGGIKVALDAMHADAELWREQAHAMESPKRALESLKLEADDVSYFSAKLGLDDTLEELRTAVGDLIGQGQQYFNEVASDLDAAAKQYQADDEAAMYELNKSQ